MFRSHGHYSRRTGRGKTHAIRKITRKMHREPGEIRDYAYDLSGLAVRGSSSRAKSPCKFYSTSSKVQVPLKKLRDPLFLFWYRDLYETMLISSRGRFLSWGLLQIFFWECRVSATRNVSLKTADVTLRVHWPNFDWEVFHYDMPVLMIPLLMYENVSIQTQSFMFVRPFNIRYWANASSESIRLWFMQHLSIHTFS